MEQALLSHMKFTSMKTSITTLYLVEISPALQPNFWRLQRTCTLQQKMTLQIFMIFGNEPNTHVVTYPYYLMTRLYELSKSTIKNLLLFRLSTRASSKQSMKTTPSFPYQFIMGNPFYSRSSTCYSLTSNRRTHFISIQIPRKFASLYTMIPLMTTSYIRTLQLLTFLSTMRNRILTSYKSQPRPSRISSVIEQLFTPPNLLTMTQISQKRKNFRVFINMLPLVIIQFL